MSNLPAFADLAAMDADDQRRLGVDTLAALQTDLAERVLQLEHDTATLKSIFGVVFGNETEYGYKSAEKDTGTITLPARDGYEIRAERKKSVSWDHDFLAAMYAKIKDAGDDPDIYIKATTTTSYSVSETVFKNWPQEYQTAFMPGRTVKPSPTVYTIKPAKKESA